jgi:hypothetical protein
MEFCGPASIAAPCSFLLLLFFLKKNQRSFRVRSFETSLLPHVQSVTFFNKVGGKPSLYIKQTCVAMPQQWFNKATI